MKSSKTASTFARRAFLNKNLLDTPGKANPALCSLSSSAAYSSATHEPVGFEAARGHHQIPGPRGLPLVGSWLDYKLNPDKVHRRDLYIKKLRSEYGDIVKETCGSRKIVHLFNPDYIKQIYDSEGKYPTIPPLLDVVMTYRSERQFSPGLGQSNGDVWYDLRKVVQKIMVRPQKALDYLPEQNKVASDFVNKLDSLLDEKGEIDNFNNWIYRWSLESAGKVCFGQDMGYLEKEGHATGDKLIKATHDVFDLSIKLFFSIPFYKYIPTPSAKKIYAYEDFLNDEILRYLDLSIEEYKAQVKSGDVPEDKFRFLSFMLNSKSISYDDVQAVMNSTFTDTLSTTSQAVLFNLYMLSIHPEVQEKAYEEAKVILSAEGDVTIDGFKESRYIKACYKETFRFLPVGIDIMRVCPADLVIGGYQVPKDTIVTMEPFPALNDPQYVRDPDVFMPERWLRDHRNTDKINPFLSIPFSHGTRMCAGRRFAEQELVIMLAKIMSRYRLEWHQDEPVNMRYRLLQTPDREVRVRFIPR